MLKVVLNADFYRKCMLIFPNPIFARCLQDYLRMKISKYAFLGAFKKKKMWFKASGLGLMMSLCRKFLHACSFITQNKQPWILHYTSSQSQYDQCTWYEPMLVHVLQPHHCLPAFHAQPVCTQCSICFGTRLCWTRPDCCSKERWVCDGGCSRCSWIQLQPVGKFKA